MSYYYSEKRRSREQVLPQADFINKVYGTMTLGLLLTAGIAQYVYLHVDLAALRGFLFPCCILELVLVLALSYVARKTTPGLAFLMFLGYAALNGVTLSSIFYVYQIGSVAKAFLVTGGTFAAMTVYGITTKKDLTSLGNICTMAILGLLIACLVNLFVRSQGFDLAISALGVLIFVGLTAYDTQKIKAIGDEGCNSTGVAVIAALTLYLDFINLFLYLLRFMGKGRK